ncbi:hypothetical protein CEP52_015539 [Fusarium oligoseptatum]|uniref:Uncharacterized protein n=1 Tax=Fusarium oligoseptatum TaxID=2604345 RepID=A0A428SC83_9HYPO|nr:hypothetical protein CEP52_015539 [Fusarium oligoseptatum]
MKEALWQRSNPVQRHGLRRLRNESERFFLWGDGVSAANGQLEKALAKSSELHQAVLSSIYELGKVVNNDLAKVVTPTGPANTLTDTRELRRLLGEAGTILNAPNTIEDPNSLSDDENGPCSFEDVLDDMATYIDCLMDLSLALENTDTYLESTRFEPTATRSNIIEPIEMRPIHTLPAVSDSFFSSHQRVETPQLSSPTIPARGHDLSLRIDDSGLPGSQAKMYGPLTLFEGTPQERVVNLGPWEVQESGQRRVVWQGSYHNEVLEHYFPSNEPSDLHPYTLLTHGRPYVEPTDRERHITFLEPHRIRYIDTEGVCIHDESISVKYEFSSFESSIHFEGDLGRKDLIDLYNTNLVWTNLNGRTDSSDTVYLTTIRRLKLWRDRFTFRYSFSMYEHSFNRQYHDYNLEDFHLETPHREDRSNGIRLLTLSQFGDRGPPPPRVYRKRPQRRRNNPSESRQWIPLADGMEYLAIVFSDHGARQRFIETWAACKTDSMPRYQRTLSNQLELPSRTIMSAHLPQERSEGDAVDLSPGPSNLADATESPGRQE